MLYEIEIQRRDAKMDKHNIYRDVDYKQHSLLNNLIYTYKMAIKHRKEIIPLGIISTICTVGSKFIWLFLGKIIIDYIIDGMEVTQLLISVGIMAGLNMIFSYGSKAAMYNLEPGIVYTRPMFIIKRNRKAIDMAYEELEKPEVFDMMEKSKQSTSWVTRGVEGMLRFSIVAIGNLATCLFSAIILFGVSPYLIPIMVLFGTLGYVIIDKTSVKDKKIVQDGLAYTNRKITYFDEITRDFEYAKDIRLYGMKGELLKRQKAEHLYAHGEVKKVKNIWIITWLSSVFIDIGREGTMFAFLIYKMLYKGMSVSNFTLYVGSVRNFAISYKDFLSNIADMRRSSRETNDYRCFNEYCENHTLTGKDIDPMEKYEFTFESVSFKYPGADYYSLKNLTLKLGASKKLAVVGLNGAGKTTFVKLLCRLYDPTEGRILLNGVDIREYDRKKYFALFSPVFQEIECYGVSICQNVSMMKNELTDKEKVIRCLEKSGLGDKIQQLERGIDTPLIKFLLEGAVDLSGGEKQKLALARALYKDAPVVIMDEPTAALDALAEYKMYKNFDELINGKTTVYISHRLSSTRFCDAIAMFEKGEMIEYGDHESLLAKGGEYAKIFEIQSQYYRETSNIDQNNNLSSSKVQANMVTQEVTRV